MDSSRTNIGFWHFAQQNPQKLAIAAPDGRHWSRGELLATSNQMSHGLRQLGLQGGDRIVALLPNTAELIALNLAATQIGCSLIPLNPKLNSQQVCQVLSDSGAWAFFAQDNLAGIATRAVKEANFPTSAAFSIGGDCKLPSYLNLVSNQPGTLPQYREAGTTLFYRPDSPDIFTPQIPPSKDSSPEQMAREMTELFTLFEIEPEAHNVHYCGSELHQLAVMLWAMNSLHYGHGLVLARQWDALQMLQAIHRYRVTTSLMVPAQFKALLTLPLEVRSQYEVSSTRYMVNHGAPCSDQHKLEMIAWWGESLYEYFPCDSNHSKCSLDVHNTQNCGQLAGVSDSLKNSQHPPLEERSSTRETVRKNH